MQSVHFNSPAHNLKPGLRTKVKVWSAADSGEDEFKGDAGIPATLVESKGRAFYCAATQIQGRTHAAKRGNPARHELNTCSHETLTFQFYLFMFPDLEMPATYYLPKTNITFVSNIDEPKQQVNRVKKLLRRYRLYLSSVYFFLLHVQS